MSLTLPKRRVASNSGGQRRVGSIQELSLRGRAISGRLRVPSSRHVSRGELFVGREGDHDVSMTEENAIHFAENKQTIMSNFEEWIKLSTDNKITTKNSWQFALIDYFHDLNVIKDGENINFQRASATLDGCVKIYLGRVESAATETGKLLSGLANKKSQVPEEGADGENDVTGNEENQSLMEDDASKKKRKINRVLESTLVEFDAIRVKKLEQELAIDPLFKKALADFDEGGAKSLLLNALSIDSTGRVVFDATTNPSQDMEKEEQVCSRPDANIDVSGLLKFVEMDGETELSICPSLAQLKLVVLDVNQAKSVLGEVNNRQDDDDLPVQDQHHSLNLDFGAPDVDGENYGEEGGFEDEDNFGNFDNPIDHFDESIVQQAFSEPEVYLGARERVLDQDLMAYFDSTMKTNWRGPEHWRVTALKRAKNIDGTIEPSKRAPDESQKTGTRKKKEQTIINFFEESDEDEEDELFEQPKNALSTTKKPDPDHLPVTTLPEDIQFNSSRLTNLFTKPQLAMMTFVRNSKDNDTFTDQKFFSEKYNERDQEEEKRQHQSFQQADYEDLYDLGNEEYGDIDFNDALGDGADVKQEPLATQLITGGRKVRPEYVTFSRIAKRVDVKLLKDNLWRSIKQEENTEEKTGENTEEKTDEKTFTEVVSSIAKMYGAEERKDLSTSFCFICLLHLANEHSLAIATADGYEDLRITGF